MRDLGHILKIALIGTAMLHSPIVSADHHNEEPCTAQLERQTGCTREGYLQKLFLDSKGNMQNVKVIIPGSKPREDYVLEWWHAEEFPGHPNFRERRGCMLYCSETCISIAYGYDIPDDVPWEVEAGNEAYRIVCLDEYMKAEHKLRNLSEFPQCQASGEKPMLDFKDLF